MINPRLEIKWTAAYERRGTLIILLSRVENPKRFILAAYLHAAKSCLSFSLMLLIGGSRDCEPFPRSISTFVVEPVFVGCRQRCFSQLQSA